MTTKKESKKAKRPTLAQLKKALASRKRKSKTDAKKIFKKNEAKKTKERK